MGPIQLAWAAAAGRIRVLAWVWLCGLGGLLSACGGGGGGGGFSVSFDTSRVSLQAVQGRWGDSAVVRAVASGDTSDGVFIGATVSGLGIMQPIPVVIDGMSATVTLTADGFLAPGRYTGTISMLACKDEMCRQHHTGSPHTVAYTVDVSPALSVSPQVLNLAVAEGGQTPSQTLSLVGGSDSTVSIRYDSGASWLSVEGTGSSRTLRADAGAGGLLAGTYRAAVVLTTRTPVVQTVEVPVFLTVTEGLLMPTMAVQQIKANSVAADLSGSVMVTAEAGAKVSTWTATSSGAGLVLETPTGSIGSALRWRWERSPLETMAYGDTLTATIDVDAGSQVTRKRMTVVLENQLAQPDQADALALGANQPGKVLVWGRGLADLPAELNSFHLHDPALNGYGLTQVTRLGPGLFELEAPALAAGRYSLRINNALGISRGPVSLNVLAPVDRPAASIDAVGPMVRALQWDAVNQAAIYRLQDGYTLARVDFSGATPTQQTKVLTRLNEFTLNRDRSQLLVSLRQGELAMLDPVSLVERSRSALGGSLPESYRSQPLALTGDNLLWLPLGDVWSSLNVYDLSRSGARVAQYGGAADYSFYLGPWAAVSGDGRRMLMPQSGSITPTPSMLWRDAVGGVNTVGSDLQRFGASAPRSFFYRSAVDRRGERWALDAADVVDFQLAPVGSLALPSEWVALSAAVSPDGSRTYVLALGPGAVGTYSEPSDAGPLPRIYVFNSSTPVIAGGPLPLVGQFDLPGHLSCRATQGPEVCEPYYAELQITDDGRSLVALGGRFLRMVPIANELRQASAQSGRARALALKPASGPGSAAAVAPATGGMRPWLAPAASGAAAGSR